MLHRVAWCYPNIQTSAYLTNAIRILQRKYIYCCQIASCKRIVREQSDLRFTTLNVERSLHCRLFYPKRKTHWNGTYSWTSDAIISTYESNYPANLIVASNPTRTTTHQFPSSCHSLMSIRDNLNRTTRFDCPCELPQATAIALEYKHWLIYT